MLKDKFDLDLDPTACKSWHWTDWVDGLTHDMETEAWGDIFSDPKYLDFWDDLKPLCTSEDVRRINDLGRRNVITFLTSRSAKGDHKQIRSTTQEWLRIQGIEHWPNVYLTPSSGKGRMAVSLGTQLAIEDNGENALDYIDAGVGCALLRRPYNESFVELVRTRGGAVVDTLSEFLDLCFRLAARQDEFWEEETVRSAAPLWQVGSRGLVQVVPVAEGQ